MSTATTLSQLSASPKSQATSFDEVAERIVLVKPKDFREQTALIDQIARLHRQRGLNHNRHFHFTLQC